MPREKKQYPTVPLLPGEIATVIDMLQQRYVRVDMYTSADRSAEHAGAIIANIRVSGPNNLLRPAEGHYKASWGGGQYRSYEAALYGALWAALDATWVQGDYDMWD